MDKKTLDSVKNAAKFEFSNTQGWQDSSLDQLEGFMSIRLYDHVYQRIEDIKKISKQTGRKEEELAKEYIERVKISYDKRVKEAYKSLDEKDSIA